MVTTMTKSLIFQESFLISGIMCFDGCGNTLQNMLKNSINDRITQKILPADAKLIVDAEPAGLGIHRLTISIESESKQFAPSKDFDSALYDQIKKDISFDIIDEQTDINIQSNARKNWLNILVNVLSMTTVLTLTVLFPPSLLLTIGLTALTFLSATFTSREYLWTFIQNLRAKNVATMATTISLGWLLSMAHTLFHSISMPLASSASMIFMSFIMPTLLISCINGMDELKRHIIEKSKKIHLAGIKTLFPQMAETYSCHKLNAEQLDVLSPLIEQYNQAKSEIKAYSFRNKEEQEQLSTLCNSLKNPNQENRKQLRDGVIIEVNKGECFPVDCILINGSTVVDASLLTGEPHQSKKLGQFIPAGAINLGTNVRVYAVKNAYNSTVNSLLFRSNRAFKPVTTNDEVPKFAYFYTALIIIGLLGAVFTPALLGIATLPLLMQNIIGILFSVCPCTVAIAHQLPQLISMHHRSRQGIQLRDEGLIMPQSNSMHTVVFDKTGTLTTGNSIVESSTIDKSDSVWQRIYLLEKAHGREHPLAQAIQNHYEKNNDTKIHFNEISNLNLDNKNRGLAAQVQGVQIHIGSFEYLKECGITLPSPDQDKIAQGFSAVCVAEGNKYKGTIYIKHEVRPGVINALSRLKAEGKQIIMLTGDNHASAKGFNKQIDSLFAEEDIHAGKTPGEKETFLRDILTKKGVDPKGLWFIGDGLNDAPCCRLVSEKGGVSCAMDATDKSTFFTDITLNGSLDYIFAHNSLNQDLQQNKMQNKGILIYSTLAFLAFIMSFSIAGIAVSPLIPMAIMLSTTMFVLFNSYRSQLNIDLALNPNNSWYKALLGSNVSIALLLAVSTLIISSTLIATIASGALALPIIAFSSIAIAFSSMCTLSAIVLAGLFTGLFSASLLLGQHHNVSAKNECVNDRSSAHKAADELLNEETVTTHALFLSAAASPRHEQASQLDVDAAALNTIMPQQIM